MTALTTREALAKALHEFYCHYQGPQEFCSGPCELNADALIASGAVVDAATLADDEALVERIIARAWTFPADAPQRTWIVGNVLRALAAALTERGDS